MFAVIQRLLLSAVVGATLLVAWPPDASGFALQSDAQARSLPDTDAGRCAAAFFELLAGPTPERIRAFETAHRSPKRLKETPMEERIRRAQSIREHMGTLTFKEVLRVGESSITILADSDQGILVQLVFEFDAEQGGKLDAIYISAGPEVGMKPETLTAQRRAEIVDEVAKAVAENYVYPEVGEKMATSIRGKLKAGEYDAIDEDGPLTRRLTDDLRAVSHDRHLGVRPTPQNPDRRKDGPSAHEIAGDNYAFRKVELLPGNIGYIRFDAFVEDEKAYQTAAAALAFVANCDALIFDLRNNGGGSPESIRFITSYLFSQRTHLNDMIDRSGKVVEEYWTLDDVPGKRFAPDLPVFVLTSSSTFSGAEEFCYNLQNLKRAAVVGETTGGGAHPVQGMRIDDRIVVGVPYMRACNPISKTNWEGVGIKPDVDVPAADALDRACELAKKAVAERRARPKE